MLWSKKTFEVGEAGDTLIEVTIALTILGVVLLGATTLASLAFRMGQTAQDRTQVSEAAQEQMEELRSYRDNSTWAVFEAGINAMPATGFHMALTSGPTTQWTPASGSLNAGPSSSLTVPTATMILSTATANNLRGCGIDFQLKYSFTTPGTNSLDSNQIETRLANLQYSGGAALCP